MPTADIELIPYSKCKEAVKIQIATLYGGSNRVISAYILNQPHREIDFCSMTGVTLSCYAYPIYLTSSRILRMRGYHNYRDVRRLYMYIKELIDVNGAIAEYNIQRTIGKTK